MGVMQFGVAVLAYQEALVELFEDRTFRTIGERTHVQLEVFCFRIGVMEDKCSKVSPIATNRATSARSFYKF